MLTYTEQVAAKVHRAAAMLDRAQPGWAARIDVGLLEMMSIDHCILGQLYRPRWWNVFAGSGWGRGRRHLEKQGYAIEVGVFASPHCQDVWIAAIADRVVAAAQASDAPASTNAGDPSAHVLERVAPRG